ncbi:MAG: desulfoferrodoxin Dfx [Treponema sp.]|nr:desulfoferrodoxin Dfx [Treponema sp.]
MQEMKPNTADASKEKHVPEVSRDGNKITVTVGSVPHPMTDEHHIAWIVAAEGDRTQRVVLPHTGAPSAGFITGSGLVTVYAYCNLHGLWMAEA